MAGRTCRAVVAPRKPGGRSTAAGTDDATLAVVVVAAVGCKAAGARRVAARRAWRASRGSAATLDLVTVHLPQARGATTTQAAGAQALAHRRRRDHGHRRGHGPASRGTRRRMDPGRRRRQRQSSLARAPRRGRPRAPGLALLAPRREARARAPTLLRRARHPRRASTVTASPRSLCDDSTAASLARRRRLGDPVVWGAGWRSSRRCRT